MAQDHGLPEPKTTELLLEEILDTQREHGGKLDKIFKLVDDNSADLGVLSTRVERLEQEVRGSNGNGLIKTVAGHDRTLNRAMGGGAAIIGIAGLCGTIAGLLSSHLEWLRTMIFGHR
jgi:hypothetical protein